MPVSNHDTERLKNLARQQMEIANSPKMQTILSDWQKHGSFKQDSRPMITIELETFRPDIVPDMMECHDDEARKLEEQLLWNIINHTLFDDDTVVSPYMAFGFEGRFTPFGLPVKVEHAPTDSQSLGHHFVEQITDLGEDFHKLGKSTFVLTPKQQTLDLMDRYNALLGDILPARLVPSATSACPTQAIVHLMSMENMFFAMYDYPELFHKMMGMLTDDYITYIKAKENDGRLGATTGEERVAQGSYCFTDRLPNNLHRYTSTDVWGYMDSQETSGLSPEMYAEFIFPYYQKVMQTMGRVSYGCCEAVDSIWDSCLGRVPNLGKVSISPWCDEEKMGNRLAGKPTTYLRKPSPNLIGVTKELDEDAVRAHFSRTVAAAKGCWLEIVQRDVYRIYDGPQKVRRYVSIIRQELLKHQK